MKEKKVVTVKKAEYSQVEPAREHLSETVAERQEKPSRKKLDPKKKKWLIAGIALLLIARPQKEEMAHCRHCAAADRGGGSDGCRAA